MAFHLELLDWLVVALVALGTSGAALAVAVVSARRHADRHERKLRQRVEVLERDVIALRRQGAVQQVFTQAAPSRGSPTLAVSETHAWSPAMPAAASITVARRSMEGLTRDAAAALASLDAFRRFAAAEGGNGFVLVQGSPQCEPVTASDPVSAADLWAVELEGATLYFPGFNLRRTQSALLADAGRPAQDRLGWVFTIEAGDQLVAYRPAVQRPGQELERGLLALPF